MIAHKRCYSLSVLVFALAILPAPLLAAIVPSGNVEPNINAWNSGTDGYIGRTNNGSVLVDAGSVLASARGYLGSYPNTTGTATATGAGSMWTNAGELNVGLFGKGFLTIEAGAQVSDTIGWLGRNSGSSGTVTVTGPGSKWMNSQFVYVGYEGGGKLTVADGGEVVAGGLVASISDLFGNGTITATHGGILDADLLFDAAHGTQASVPFGSGGTLTVQVADGSLGVGFRQSGSLNVTEGVTISSGIGYLGYHSGSSGTATITGMGSAWNLNGWELDVGRSGSGTLTIESGGLVSNGVGCLGFGPGSTGTATVTGPGSRWTQAGGFYVGREGNGSLTIEGGGQVSNGDSYVGYGSGTTGAVMVTGAGSKWTSGRLSVGVDGSGVVTVADGGEVVAAELDASLSDLHGNGIITVTKGGMIDADIVFDATHSAQAIVPFGSGGTMLFSAAGGALGIGCRQTGSLSVSDGVSISSSIGTLGEDHGSTGTATITGAGSKWTITEAVIHGAELSVGNSGNGELTIENGGEVSNRFGAVGRSPGSTGRVTVTGANSKWINHEELWIGGFGNGMLTIEAGSQVTSILSMVAVFEEGLGTVKVTGEGSKWTNQGNLTIGYRGNGMLTIEAGGEVSNTQGNVGLNASPIWPSTVPVPSTGKVTVTGTGSKWVNSGALTIGSYGYGTLTIEAGGQVSNTQGIVGASDWSVGEGMGTGAVVVTGAGSKWTNTGSLDVGRYGIGALSITGAGLVTVGGTLTIDHNLDGDSFVNMATGGMLALAGDADDSLTQFLGLVSGTDAIRYWDTSLANWAPLNAAIHGLDYSLSYLTDGDLAGYTLLTVGRAGDFDNDGHVDGADYLAWQRGNSPNPLSSSDLADWRANFGTSALTTASAAVPEPTSIVLFLMAIIAGCATRKAPTPGRDRFAASRTL